MIFRVIQSHELVLLGDISTDAMIQRLDLVAFPFIGVIEGKDAGEQVAKPTVWVGFLIDLVTGYYPDCIIHFQFD